MTHYDVIIIGTGAGGGTLARHLAPSGKRILLLERGGWLPREPQNVSSEEVFVNNRYVPKDTWRYPNGEEFQPGVHYCVGGATKLYGAALYRLREEDFGELQHHGGISPAWPVGYDEFEPYYMLAEQRYCVHGARGEDPTEPPASGPYPFPAVSHEPRIQQLHDDLAALGHHPFHAPCGVMLNEANMPYSACMRCQNCDGFPCIVHAKSDAEVLGVRPALEHDNVELLIDAEAVRLQTDSTGKAVTGVVVNHAGSEETLTADLVVVSCGAANSARLLLMSANDQHPNGLANGSDQVGRNYMFHNSQAVLALSMEENPTIFQKTLGLNDFYLSGPDFEFPMGNIQMVGKSQAPMFHGEKPGETRFAPNWSLEDVARHAVDFWLSTEDLPRAENRVTVDAQGTITIAYGATNNEPKDRLYEQLKSMVAHLGMHHHHLLPHNAYLKNEIPVAGVAHQAGTCRFGSDPSSSVLDVNCKAHELDNLYVADTSFFPSIGAVNPALTAMANALRVGDHLLERMGATVPATGEPGGLMSETDGRRHVVIIGGGFAGLGCARRLADAADVRVTLIDRNNYHQFQPLLYQVATSLLSPSDIAHSLREVFADQDNVDVKLAEISAIDPATRTIRSTDGGEWTADALVLAAGSQPNFFKTPGAAEHAFPLYSLDNATELRSRILGLFEQVDRHPDLIKRGALNFVIVGGGPTGVEVAGALADMVSVTVPAEYRDLDVSAANIYLLDFGDALLKPFSDKAHAYVARVLTDRNVQLRLGTGVKEVGAGHALLSDGATLPTRCVIWGGGITAAGVAADSGLGLGRGGRVDVQADLTIADHPGVYAIGDVANILGPDGNALPQLGSVALQSGQAAAANILADFHDKPRSQFAYRDKGIMAMIGRGAAIAEVGKNHHEVHGQLAHVAWMGVHASLMTGTRDKIEAIIDWSWDRFSKTGGPHVLDRGEAAEINWEDDPVVNASASASDAPAAD